MKFIHAADLHIDSPLRGLDFHDGAPVELIRGATRKAFVALVDLALREQVQLVLLAGDTFDRDLGDFRSALFFREQLVRLSRAGIRTFVVKGNHDAEGQISRRLPDVEGVHVFSSRAAEVIDLPLLGVAIHGRSFPDRVVTEDLLAGYRPAVTGRFNIGILHTSLNGRPGHDPYAPTDLASLEAKGYDYFALGHVHAREVVRESRPRVVFPGNLQGRHVGEAGSKGCELVAVESGQIVSADHVSLDTVRWHQLPLDASGLDSPHDLAAKFREHCRELASEAPDRLHAVRVVVHGRTGLGALEAREPGTVAAALWAATQEFESAAFWIESVRLQITAPFDRLASARRPDAIGEVITVVDELLADDDRLLAWVRRHVDGPAQLPAELSDLDPARLPAGQWRSLLADAEATVMSRLSGPIA